MPAGLDIGEKTVFVATSGGTTRYRNAVCRVEDDAEFEDSRQHIRTESGVYAVGDAVEEYANRGADNVQRLLGGAGDVPHEVSARAIEALLLASNDSDSEQPSDARVGYVDRYPDERATARAVLDELEADSVTVDPAVAVCYESFETAASGLGIFIDDGRAVATLVAGGVPVASATVTYDGRWYDVTGAATVADGEGPKADWARIRYETLLGNLAFELSADAPAFEQPLSVVVGGGCAPLGLESHLVSVFAEGLQTAVESVTIVDSSDDAPARGALIAARSDSEQHGAVPGFAADVGYVPALADISETVAVFDSGGRDARTRVAGSDARERADGQRGDGTDSNTMATTRHRVDHYSTRLATAHDQLVTAIEAEGTGMFELEEFREDVWEAIETIEDELELLDEEAARAQTLGDLDESVAELEQAFEDAEEDVREVRAVLSGLDGDQSIELPEGSTRALDSMAIDTLEHDIDAVESNLSDRIDQLWSELDDINSTLVDVSAELRDVPALESKLESTTESVASLTEEAATLRQSLANLQEEIDDSEQETATVDEVDSVADQLDQVADDLDDVQKRVNEIDQAEPEGLDDIQHDLDTVRNVLNTHESRLEGVERTTSDLDDRVVQAFQDTAKTEALSSVQTEVSRLQQQTTSTQETATSAEQTAEKLEKEVETLQRDVEQIRTMSDRLAESSVTRSELGESLDEVSDRLDQLETEFEETSTALTEQLDNVSNQGAASTSMLQVLSVALASAGLLGALLAAELDQTVAAAGFIVLVVGSAVWLWLSI